MDLDTILALIAAPIYATMRAESRAEPPTRKEQNEMAAQAVEEARVIWRASLNRED